tara:strand:+ start:290 stop:2677 length:2388 start_codon:yes stop_codon:yes gene_type:complete
MADDAKKKIKDVNDELGNLEDQLLSIANSLSNTIKNAIEDIKDESADVAAIFEKNLFRSIKNIAKESDNILKNTLKLYQGTSKVKDIQKDVSNLLLKQLASQRNIDNLLKLGAISEDQHKRAVNELNDAYTIQLRLLQSQEEEAEKIQKTLGLTGSLLKGINKIPLLGDVIDTNIALQSASIAIAQGANRTQAMKVAFKTLGGQIKTSLTDPLFASTAIIALLLKGFLSVDKAQTDFQRETGKTVDHFNTLNTSLISSSDYIKQATALTKELGLNSTAIFPPSTIQEAAELTNLIGLSADEANRLAMLSKVSGKELLKTDQNIVKMVDHFNKSNKTAISAKAILQDVSKVSNAIAITFGNNPEKIAAAAVEARKLGLTLEGVNATADSLLNFESSINNEISAELITGQQLNLDKARLLSLNDDIAGLTKEIGTNEGIINGFTKGNRIQRQAIADAIGMSKEDLAKMVMTQKIQEGLSGQALANATGISLEDMKRLAIQDKISKAVEKVGEAFAPIVGFFADLVSNAFVLKTLMLAIAGIIATKLVIGTGQLVANLISVVSGAYKWLTTSTAQTAAQAAQTTIGTTNLVIAAERLTAEDAIAIMQEAQLGTQIASIPIAETNAVIATERATAENSSKLSLIGQKIAEIASMPFKTASALISGEKAIAEITAAEAATLGIATIAIVGGLAAAVMAMKSSKSSLKDGMIAPDGGLMVSGAKGTYKLDPNDSVIAGTDLNKKTPAAGRGGGQDLSPLLNEMKALRQEQAKSNSKPTIVENSMNGTKFGTSVAMNTYKTQ